MEIFMNIQSIQNNTTYPTVQERNEMLSQKRTDNAFNNTVQKSDDSTNNDTQKQQNNFIQDEYIHTDTSKQATGLYKLDYAAEGTPTISFDNPRKKIEDNQETKQTENCTGNTDKVDREIKQLKEEKKQLEQRLHSVLNPQKAADLEKQLTKVEQELQQKDNDVYRRQHTVFSK